MNTSRPQTIADWFIFGIVLLEAIGILLVATLLTADSFSRGEFSWPAGYLGLFGVIAFFGLRRPRQWGFELPMFIVAAAGTTIGLISVAVQVSGGHFAYALLLIPAGIGVWWKHDKRFRSRN